MQIKVCCVALMMLSCSDGSGTPSDAGVDASGLDAPESMPTLTSFSPTPTMVSAAVPTMITWNWTFLVEPVIPTPVCTIDNGVGVVTRGQMTMVTLTATTTYRLSCANRVGMTARDTVIAIPPAPPTLATFTVTPSPVMPSVATPATFSWTYSTTPSPVPTCTIDAGIGAATQGMMSTLTLPQARTYRLRCTNTQGTSFRDATVAVNECAGGTNDCGANTTCTDTDNGFTCACNAGYAGNGDVCSATNLACSTPGVCSLDAICVGTNTCVCNPGFVGDGLTCARLPIMFTTSASGTGNLSTWANAGGFTGLAAADNVCNVLATASSLPGAGNYKAWMSDATDDAYCRVRGQTGKKGACVGTAVAAGPWVRSDALRQPTAPTLDNLLAPTRQTLFPATYTQAGVDVSATTPLFIWTGTNDTGAVTGTACSNWASADGGGTIRGAMGDLGGGGTSWTDQGADPTCASSGRLRCVEVAAGPALPSRHPANGKKAFVTSVVGNGAFSTWADAQGSTGVAAADQVCQARARSAGYANATNFKAWLAYYATYAYNRFTYNGPWYRPDGVLVATSKPDLYDTRLASPMYLTETNAYLMGDAETGTVWTGARSDGFYYSSSTSLYACSTWASSTSNGIVGRHDLSDFRWSNQGSSSIPTYSPCSAADYHIYCLEDSP